MHIIIDNYDSFTYNLVHIVEELTGEKVMVKRNDQFDIEELANYDKIILSPGPGIPSEAGKLLEVIRVYSYQKPILGVCLGLQAIGEVYGGQLRNLDEVYHGIQSEMHIVHPSPIFKDIPSTFLAGRYHSWVIDKASKMNKINITCIDEKGEIMAIQHQTYPLFGVQFHPESIMTPEGANMIENFLKL
jgi:anthranilate synthase component 2